MAQSSYIAEDEQLETCYQPYQSHFRKRPASMRLVRFPEGKLFLSPLNQFYIIVEGSVSIYDVSEMGQINYISVSGKGTLLGDLEFSGIASQPFFIKAAEDLVCLTFPFDENADLQEDPAFLRFVLNQVARKLSLSVSMGPLSKSLEDNVLFYLRTISPDHRIASVNQVLPQLHCSRRQLQRVLKKLCNENIIERCGRGTYILKPQAKEGDEFAQSHSTPTVFIPKRRLAKL